MDDADKSGFWRKEEVRIALSFYLGANRWDPCETLLGPKLKKAIFEAAAQSRGEIGKGRSCMAGGFFTSLIGFTGVLLQRPEIYALSGIAAMVAIGLGLPYLRRRYEPSYQSLLSLCETDDQRRNLRGFESFRKLLTDGIIEASEDVPSKLWWPWFSAAIGKEVFSGDHGRILLLGGGNPALLRGRGRKPFGPVHVRWRPHRFSDIDGPDADDVTLEANVEPLPAIAICPENNAVHEAKPGKAKVSSHWLYGIPMEEFTAKLEEYIAVKGWSLARAHVFREIYLAAHRLVNAESKRLRSQQLQSLVNAVMKQIESRVLPNDMLKGSTISAMLSKVL